MGSCVGASGEITEVGTLPEQQDDSDIPRESAPPVDPAPKVDPTDLLARQEPAETQQAVPVNSDPDVNVFNVNVSLGSVKPLPTDVLSPEIIERLRSGGLLSVDDLNKLRSATSTDSSIAEKLLEGMLAAGFAKTQEPDGADPNLPADLAGDPRVVVVPGSMQKFTWNWMGNDPARDDESQPATYYEALTGKTDPMRGFFVKSRHVLNAVTWILALGVPTGLITLGIVLGLSPETIFFLGFGGLIVGKMIRDSFPKTPFG